MLARSILRRRPRGLRALSSAPLLPRWGSFGKDASQIDGFIETVREEGAQHVKLTRELAERGLRLYMMLTRPHLWFSDAEWRKGWLEQAAEPMDRYARVNYQLESPPHAEITGLVVTARRRSSLSPCSRRCWARRARRRLCGSGGSRRLPISKVIGHTAIRFGD